MPFGLKSAGSTYQWLVNGNFKDLIGKSMEVYVDDMLVKSKTTGDHIEHSELDVQYSMKVPDEA